MSLEEPELLVTGLDDVAASGGRVRIPAAAWPAADAPAVGRAVVLREDGLSKPGVIAGIESNGDLAVDVAGDRVASLAARPPHGATVAVDELAAPGLAALLAPFLDSTGRLLDVPPMIAAQALALLPGDLAHDRLNGQPPMSALVALAEQLGGRLVGALSQPGAFVRFDGIQVPVAVAGSLAEQIDSGWPAVGASAGALECATAESWLSWTAVTPSWCGIARDLLGGNLPADTQVVGLWWD